MSALTTYSDELSSAVAAAEGFVVSVHGGRRYGASGVIWRPGVIVTTDHGLERDDDLSITTAGGARADAVLAGRDPSTDLAVLKAPSAQGAAARRAPQEGLRIGHLALAIARLGEQTAASMGIVSALGDAWTTWRGGRVDRFIRADLTLYPGFSGGPLVDSSGGLVGINTSGLARNWSVTVPATTVDRVVDGLLAKGRITRGYLGVGLQAVRIPDAIARGLSLPNPAGAIVVAVEPDSPAERGGVLIGDVLVGMNGTPVADVHDLHRLLGPDTVGVRSSLRVVRAGALADVPVTVGERAYADDER